MTSLVAAACFATTTDRACAVVTTAGVLRDPAWGTLPGRSAPVAEGGVTAAGAGGPAIAEAPVALPPTTAAASRGMPAVRSAVPPATDATSGTAGRDCAGTAEAGAGRCPGATDAAPGTAGAAGAPGAPGAAGGPWGVAGRFPAPWRRRLLLMVSGSCHVL